MKSRSLAPTPEEIWDEAGSSGVGPKTAEELISRGELDIEEYKDILITLFKHKGEPKTSFNLDHHRFPQLARERLAAGQPIPKEAYRAYLWIFGQFGAGELAYAAPQSRPVEVGYIPELAEEASMLEGHSEALGRLMSNYYQEIVFNPELQRAVARYGSEFVQHGLLSFVEFGQLDQRAADTLKARGSSYASGCDPNRPTKRYPWERRVAAPLEGEWRAGLKEIVSKYRETIHSARCSAWPAADFHAPACEYRRRGKKLIVSESQWQTLFTFIEDASEARAVREQAIDEFVAYRLTQAPDRLN